MSNILWMYKNMCEFPSVITETWGTTNSDFGTAKLADNNLQSYWSTQGISPGPGTVANILFDMGSAIYADSLIVVHNMNVGTLFFGAGGTTPIFGTSDAFYGLPIYGNTGTSVNYLANPVGFRYWRLFCNGTKLTEITKIKEVFIGKRDTFPINPEYPFRKEIESSTIVTESEKGQRKVYHKYTKQRWGFSYPGISEAVNGTMNKIRDFCGGSYRPLWMCLDKDDDKFATYFVRFVKNSFKTIEIIDNVHDVEFSVEEEL